MSSSLHTDFSDISSRSLESKISDVPIDSHTVLLKDDDQLLRLKIRQVMELTNRTSDEAAFALHDADNDVNKAVNFLLEASSVHTFQNEWKTTVSNRKKKNLQNVLENNEGQKNKLKKPLVNFDNKKKKEKELKIELNLSNQESKDTIKNDFETDKFQPDTTFNKSELLDNENKFIKIDQININQETHKDEEIKNSNFLNKNLKRPVTNKDNNISSRCKKYEPISNQENYIFKPFRNFSNTSKLKSDQYINESKFDEKRNKERFDENLQKCNDDQNWPISNKNSYSRLSRGAKSFNSKLTQPQFYPRRIGPTNINKNDHEDQLTNSFRDKSKLNVKPARSFGSNHVETDRNEMNKFKTDRYKNKTYLNNHRYDRGSYQNKAPPNSFSISKNKIYKNECFNKYPKHIAPQSESNDTAKPLKTEFQNENIIWSSESFGEWKVDECVHENDSKGNSKVSDKENNASVVTKSIDIVQLLGSALKKSDKKESWDDDILKDNVDVKGNDNNNAEYYSNDNKKASDTIKNAIGIGMDKKSETPINSSIISNMWDDHYQQPKQNIKYTNYTDTTNRHNTSFKPKLLPLSKIPNIPVVMPNAHLPSMPVNFEFGSDFEFGNSEIMNVPSSFETDNSMEDSEPPSSINSHNTKVQINRHRDMPLGKDIQNIQRENSSSSRTNEKSSMGLNTSRYETINTPQKKTMPNNRLQPHYYECERTNDRNPSHYNNNVRKPQIDKADDTHQSEVKFRDKNKNNLSNLNSTNYLNNSANFNRNDAFSSSSHTEKSHQNINSHNYKDANETKSNFTDINEKNSRGLISSSNASPHKVTHIRPEENKSSDSLNQYSNNNKQSLQQNNEKSHKNVENILNNSKPSTQFTSHPSSTLNINDTFVGLSVNNTSNTLSFNNKYSVGVSQTTHSISAANRLQSSFSPAFTPLLNPQYALGQALGLPYFTPPIYSYEDLQLLQRFPMAAGFYDFSSTLGLFQQTQPQQSHISSLTSNLTNNPAANNALLHNMMNNSNQHQLLSHNSSHNQQNYNQQLTSTSLQHHHNQHQMNVHNSHHHNNSSSYTHAATNQQLASSNNYNHTNINIQNASSLLTNNAGNNQMAANNSLNSNTNSNVYLMNQLLPGVMNSLFLGPTTVQNNNMRPSQFNQHLETGNSNLQQRSVSNLECVGSNIHHNSKSLANNMPSQNGGSSLYMPNNLDKKRDSNNSNPNLNNLSHYLPQQHVSYMGNSSFPPSPGMGILYPNGMIPTSPFPQYPPITAFPINQPQTLIQQKINHNRFVDEDIANKEVNNETYSRNMMSKQGPTIEMDKNKSASVTTYIPNSVNKTNNHINNNFTNKSQINSSLKINHPTNQEKLEPCNKQINNNALNNNNNMNQNRIPYDILAVFQQQQNLQNQSGNIAQNQGAINAKNSTRESNHANLSTNNSTSTGSVVGHNTNEICSEAGGGIGVLDHNANMKVSDHSHATTGCEKQLANISNANNHHPNLAGSNNNATNIDNSFNRFKPSNQSQHPTTTSFSHHHSSHHNTLHHNEQRFYRQQNSQPPNNNIYFNPHIGSSNPPGNQRMNNTNMNASYGVKQAGNNSSSLEKGSSGNNKVNNTSQSYQHHHNSQNSYWN
ncbi:unnamed protein product [Gordionus sp. m RMFG-2023]